jgi:ribonuclease PH
VLCTVSIEDRVPMWMANRHAGGWLTAEYAMLPGSAQPRKPRDGRTGRPPDGRSQEIQRLIGRALRSSMDLAVIPECTFWVDCDVIQADGGTRTTAISGAYVALLDLLRHMEQKRVLRGWPLVTELAAVSVGMVEGEALCDLCYTEDSAAQTDMNLVMTGDGRFIEVQGSAEAAPFSRAELDTMLGLGEAAIRQVFELQKAALATP